MAGEAVLYLFGGSAILLLLTVITAVLERWMPEAVWEKLFEIAGWYR